MPVLFSLTECHQCLSFLIQSLCHTFFGLGTRRWHSFHLKRLWLAWLCFQLGKKNSQQWPQCHQICLNCWNKLSHGQRSGNKVFSSVSQKFLVGSIFICSSSHVLGSARLSRLGFRSRRGEPLLAVVIFFCCVTNWCDSQSLAPTVYCHARLWL